jgi:hypothetical protein
LQERIEHATNLANVVPFAATGAYRIKIDPASNVPTGVRAQSYHQAAAKNSSKK